MYLFTGGNMLRKFLLVIICSLLIIPQSVFSAELTDFVPADAGVFIRLNLKQIFSNPEIKAKYDEFFAEAKFDYVKDIKDMGLDINNIYNLTFFMPFEMIQADKVMDSKTAFIVEGKFDTKKMIESMKKISSEINKDRPYIKYSFSEEDGIPTISYTDEKLRKAKSFLFDNAFMVLGSESGANAAKDVRMGKSPNIKTNKEFTTVLDRLNKEATFAFAVKINDEVRQSITKIEKVKALETIQFISVDFTKESDLLVKVNGYFSNSADMEAVTKIIKMFIDSGKETKAPFTACIDFIENSKIVYEGKVATVNSKITQESINEIIRLITNEKSTPEQAEE